MNKKQKGIKLLNPLTVLYLVILLAVVSALFDYKITIVSVLVMMLLAGISGEGKPYFLLWLKSIFLICVICFVLQSLFIPGEQIIWKVWVFSIKVESVQMQKYNKDHLDPIYKIRRHYIAIHYYQSC